MADEDGWQGPRRNDEGGFGRLIAQIRDIAARLEAVERGAPLRAAGIGVDESGLIVDSSLSVIGDILLNYRGSAEHPGRLNAYVAGSSGRAVVRITPPYTTSLDDTALYLEGPSSGVSQGYVVIASGGDIALRAARNALITGSVVGFRTPRADGWSVDINSVGDRFNATADNGFTLTTPTNTHRIQTVGNDIGIDAPSRLYVAANVYATGNLACGGTKPFVIDHPTKVDKSLVHVATESDKAVVEYHYRVTIGNDGSVVIDLPDYFEALTAPDSRGVQVTPVGRPFMVGADEPADGQVVIYGDPGRDVFVRINARRGDEAGQFDVEIPRIQPPAEETPDDAA